MEMMCPYKAMMADGEDQCEPDKCMFGVQVMREFGHDKYGCVELEPTGSWKCLQVIQPNDAGWYRQNKVFIGGAE